MSAYLSSCPFCSSINPTIAEQLDTNDAVVVAKLRDLPPKAEADALELPKATFEVTKVIKGEAFVGVGSQIRTILIGNHQIDDRFMLVGVDPPSMAWSTPIRTNDRIIEYYERIPLLPASGPERLVYFMDFFEDEEDVLAADAYDEFALASYADVQAIKDKMPREKLLAWIQDENVLESRKRLYLTMLGVCGKPKDVEVLEKMLQEPDREKRVALDALTACYLRLRGPAGLPFIEKHFLKNSDAEYVDVFSVIQALRFHSTEVEDISKARIAEAMRHVLDHPKIADIVVPDLARLEDWSVADRLANMFKDADSETKWIRTPIASYMLACPKPKAVGYLKEFRSIDTEAVRRAEMMANFDLFDDLEQETDEEGLDADEPDGTEDPDGPDGTEGTEGTEGPDGTEDPNGIDGADDGTPVTRKNVQPNLDPSVSMNNSVVGDVTASRSQARAPSGSEGPSAESLTVFRRPNKSTSDPPSRQYVSSASEVTALRQNADLPPILGDSDDESVLGVAQVNDSAASDSTTLGMATTPVPWAWLVGVPMLAAGCLMLLLWSVISGRFERLIF